MWQRYEYDAANRLKYVKNDAGTTTLATYTYGASNQRLKTVDGSSTNTWYVWEGGKVIAEYNTVSGVNVTWQKNYVYLGERLLATESTTIATQFHHPDRLGTRLATNASDGSSAGEQENLPFGTALGAGISGNQRRFTSYDRSTTTKLDYAVNRTYNAGLGRFTQVDPIAMNATDLTDPQSLNLYAYCQNDPINHTDSDGLFLKGLMKVFKWIVAVLAIAVAIVTVMYAPQLFTTTWKAVFGIIKSIADAGASLMDAMGKSKASSIFGAISAGANFMTSLLDVAEAKRKALANGVKRAIWKAVAAGATLASRVLSVSGQKVAGQWLGLTGTVSSFIGEGYKEKFEIIDKKKVSKGYQWTPTSKEIWKFARSSGQQIAALAGATEIADHFNVAGIIDDVWDLTSTKKDFNKPADEEREWNGTTYTRSAQDKSHWRFQNRLKVIGDVSKKASSIITRLDKGVALAR